MGVLLTAEEERAEWSGFRRLDRAEVPVQPGEDLSRDAEAVERFQREARAASSLDAAAGQRAEAQAVLARLTERSSRQYVASYDIAMVLLALGQDEAFFAALP